MLAGRLLANKIDFQRVLIQPSARALSINHNDARCAMKGRFENGLLRSVPAASTDFLTRPKIENKCANCLTQLHSYAVVCKSCGALRSAEVSRAFVDNPWLAFKCTADRLLQYDLDIESLRTEYLQLMKDLHPDRRPQSELELANQHSSMIKAAYDVLSNPVRRAEFICRLLYNIECFTEDANIDDDEFMMDLLSANEYILEELKPPSVRNHSRLPDDTLRFKIGWEVKLEKQLSNLMELFDKLKNLQGQRPSEAHKSLLDSIRESVHACVAIEKLLGQLEERVLELGYDITE